MNVILKLLILCLGIAILSVTIVMLKDWCMRIVLLRLTPAPEQILARYRHWQRWAHWSCLGWALLWSILNVLFTVTIIFKIADAGFFIDADRGDISALVTLALSALLVLTLYIISRFDFSWLLKLLLVAGVVFWVCLLFTSSWLIPQWASLNAHSHAWIERPGTLFVALLGLITIAGFIVTISQLHETNARITDYPTLIKRLTFLLNEAHSLQRHVAKVPWRARLWRYIYRVRGGDADNDGHVRIYVRTLGLGSMSTPPEVFRRYREAVNLLFGSGKWMLIQSIHSDAPELARLPSEYTIAQLKEEIEKSSLGQFFLSFENRHFAAPDIAYGYKMARELGAQFEKVDRMDDRQFQPRPNNHHSELPSYHLFVSPCRAIVITPLDMPIGASGKILGRNTGPVHVVAVETTNRHVINELIFTFRTIGSECGAAARTPAAMI